MRSVTSPDLKATSRSFSFEHGVAAGIGTVAGLVAPEARLGLGDRAILRQIISKRLSGAIKNVRWSTAVEMGKGLFGPGLTGDLLGAGASGAWQAGHGGGGGW